jgi:hypothetical protein
MMREHLFVPFLFVGLMLTASAAQAQYQVLNLVAGKVIERYQSST